MQDLKTWTCGHCERIILVPPESDADYHDTLARIREHRFGHLTEALMHGSDEDLWGLCGDESAESAPPELVDSDDVAPVLVGIEGLLRDDLPRARQLWYPINEDGGFNR